MNRLSKFLFIGMLLFVNEATAFDFEKLFMPGEVIAGHVKYELDCKQCHSRMRDTSQKQLCMDCHEEIAKDVNGGKGYHGIDDKASSSECKVCHTEHKGRKATIVWLDKDRFNHDNTDYPLLGRHRDAGCESCHKEDKKYAEAPGLCIDCHREDDAHEEKLGEKCETCHNEKSWSSEQFDHDKTDFKLEGTHQDVACDLCHVEQGYKDTPKECVSCHAIKDFHKNRFGKKCENCHKETKWDEAEYDHERETNFELKGAHQKLICHACHSATYKIKGKERKNRTCYKCHKLDDVHDGQNGEKCEGCHNEKSWLQAEFDHAKETKFPLRGAHKETSCQACHQVGSKDLKLETDCYSCHKHEDAHNEQEGKLCDNCHNETTWWLKDVRFDHELSEFPLIGQHAVVGCEACHPTSAFKDAGETCNDCHQEDDTHEQSLGEDCQRCHNPNAWLIWEFDHDDTDFKLQGAHEKQHCNSCHYKPMLEAPQESRLCNECHNRDDIHDGNFGSDCGACHTQENFRKIKLQGLKIRGR